MTEPARHYADPSAEARQLRERMEQLRTEAKAATPERRNEIGWWLWGASKHLGRLAGIALSRRFGEHRFVIERWTHEGSYSICSCGAAIPGHVGHGLAAADFLAAAGHFPLVADDTTLSPTLLDRRLAECGDDAARLTVLRQWIVEVEEAMAAAAPSDRQRMALWVWAARQSAERITRERQGISGNRIDGSGKRA